MRAIAVPKMLLRAAALRCCLLGCCLGFWSERGDQGPALWAEQLDSGGARVGPFEELDTRGAAPTRHVSSAGTEELRNHLAVIEDFFARLKSLTRMAEELEKLKLVEKVRAMVEAAEKSATEERVTGLDTLTQMTDEELKDVLRYSMDDENMLDLLKDALQSAKVDCGAATVVNNQSLDIAKVFGNATVTLEQIDKMAKVVDFLTTYRGTIALGEEELSVEDLLPTTRGRRKHLPGG